MLIKRAVVCLVAVMLSAAPAAAQNHLPAGSGAGGLNFWEGYSIGTYIIVGGLVFVVTIGGLQLVSGDDKSKPKPAPVVPTPSTSTPST